MKRIIEVEKIENKAKTIKEKSERVMTKLNKISEELKEIWWIIIKKYKYYKIKLKPKPEKKKKHYQIKHNQIIIIIIIMQMMAN